MNLPKDWKIQWKRIPLSEVVYYEQPNRYMVTSKIKKSGKYSVLTPGKSFIKGYTDEVDGVYENFPVIIFDDFTTASKYVDFHFKVKSSAMKILKNKGSNINLKYVFYQMKLIRINASTHKRYYLSKYQHTPFLFPFKDNKIDITTQQLIVAEIEKHLTRIDDSIKSLKLIKSRLKTYRNCILNEFCRGKKTDTIESVINSLDQGWSPKCLNKSARKEEWGVIKTTAIQADHFDDSKNKVLPIELKPRIQHELKEGDILITRAGPRVRVGICCMIKRTRSKLMNCDKVYRIRVNPKLAIPEYIVLLLNSPKYLHVIEKMKTGISDSGVNITQKGFKNIQIPIPEIREQNTIVKEIESKFSVIDKIEIVVESSLKKAEQLRKSILKSAFEGKLVKVGA